MANPEHVEWLLEGVAAWNKRRTTQQFVPDLSGVNLSEMLVEAQITDSQDGKPDLSEVNLSQANLTGCDLSDCTLNLAKFSGADLKGARFERSNFVGADLTEAQLQNAVLSFSNLIAANLERANLNSCALEGAKIEYANLSGANLTGARPWQASMTFHILPDQDDPRVSMNDAVTSVASLLECINRIKQHYASKKISGEENIEIFFRGEARDSWNLAPKVMRPSKDTGYSLRSAEGELLVELMSRRPEDFRGTISALDQMVIAQHHRLPTRLLDITINPLVALFHACEDIEEQSESASSSGRIHVFAAPRNIVKPFNSDTVSVVTNFARLSRNQQNLLLGKTKDETRGDSEPSYIVPERLMEDGYALAMNRLYQFIRLERTSFQERIDPKDLLRVFVVKPRYSFERIRAQSGAFLISAFYERFEEAEIRKWSDDVPVYHHYTLAVPSDSKETVRDELEVLNITRETMLPGLDEAAKAVTDRYRRA